MALAEVIINWIRVVGGVPIELVFITVLALICFIFYFLIYILYKLKAVEKKSKQVDDSLVQGYVLRVAQYGLFIILLYLTDVFMGMYKLSDHAYYIIYFIATVFIYSFLAPAICRTFRTASKMESNSVVPASSFAVIITLEMIPFIFLSFFAEPHLCFAVAICIFGKWFWLDADFMTSLSEFNSERKKLFTGANKKNYKLLIYAEIVFSFIYFVASLCFSHFLNYIIRIFLFTLMTAAIFLYLGFTRKENREDSKPCDSSKY